MPVSKTGRVLLQQYTAPVPFMQEKNPGYAAHIREKDQILSATSSPICVQPTFVQPSDQMSPVR